MTSIATRELDNGATPDLQTIMSDIAALKRDLAALLHNVKGNVADDARTAAGHLSEEALRVYANLAERSERSVKAVGRQVEEQPVMSLLIAFAIGFLGSRMLSR